MIVDRYGEALVRTQLLQQNIVEAIESSCWHVVRLRVKGGKWREREREKSEGEHKVRWCYIIAYIPGCCTRQWLLSLWSGLDRQLQLFVRPWSKLDRDLRAPYPVHGHSCSGSHTLQTKTVQYKIVITQATLPLVLLSCSGRVS